MELDAFPLPARASRLAPELPSGSVWGHLRSLRRDPLELFMRAADTLGDVARLRMAHRWVVLIRDPEHVKYVLQDHVPDFSKQTRGYKALRRVLGNGLVTSEGSFWLRQRRIAQPGFHRQRIARFGETMTLATLEMLERWEEHCERNEEIDLDREMMGLTMRIVGRTLLSHELGFTKPAVGGALHVLLHDAIDRAMAPLDLPLVFPTPKNRALAASKRILDEVVYDIIGHRRRSGEKKDDLLDMLMNARDADTGEGMSDVQLRDEVMTVFLAGHETTANALTWTFLLLSRHPEAAERIKAEADAVLAGRTPTVEDLPRLPYGSWVLQESMRLYPPVWIVMRRCEKPQTLGGYRIPVGTFVAISPYVSHRNPRYFPEPSRFEPERFSPERAGAIPRFAYLPFSAGPRICIGNNFAMMEAHLVLTTILQRYTVTVRAGHEPELDPTITLRPRKALPARLAHAPPGRKNPPTL